MAQNALIAAGPKLQRALRDLTNGVKDVDISAHSTTGKQQNIISRVATSNPASGMFTVSLYGTNGVAVKGGFTDLESRPFPDTVLENQDLFRGPGVFLTATLKLNTWVLAIEVTLDNSSDLYIPGEKIYYKLAQFYRTREDFSFALYQLHHGGMVNFKELYYIES